MLYGTVSSIKMISLALTMTMSGWADVSRISAGKVDGGLSVALNPGRSANSLSPGWRHSLRPLARIFKALSHSLRPLARIFKALSCRQVYLPCEKEIQSNNLICVEQ